MGEPETRPLSVTNTPQKVCERDKKRVSISIYNYYDNAANLYVYSEVPDGSTGNNFIELQTGETLILNKSQDDDVTGAFWVQRRGTGTSAVRVKMEYAN